MSGPRIVTLCGSSRFPDAFALAEMHLSMRGDIMFGLSCYGHADLPRQKIAMSDAVFVINPSGYLRTSTRREIAYARELGKTVEWLFPPTAEELAEAGLVAA